jgi:hypothetical protein
MGDAMTGDSPSLRAERSNPERRSHAIRWIASSLTLLAMTQRAPSWFETRGCAALLTIS